MTMTRMEGLHVVNSISIGVIVPHSRRCRHQQEQVARYLQTDRHPISHSMRDTVSRRNTRRWRADGKAFSCDADVQFEGSHYDSCHLGITCKHLRDDGKLADGT